MRKIFTYGIAVLLAAVIAYIVKIAPCFQYMLLGTDNPFYNSVSAMHLAALESGTVTELLAAFCKRW